MFLFSFPVCVCIHIHACPLFSLDLKWELTHLTLVFLVFHYLFFLGHSNAVDFAKLNLLLLY